MPNKAGTVFVHPKALCESSSVGDGTKVWPFAHIMEDAKVGAHCNIGDHAFIETGAVLGDRVTLKNGVMVWNGLVIEDDVFVGPGVIFTNDMFPRSRRMPAASNRYEVESNWLSHTRVRRGASIGAGAVILPEVQIGEYAMVAAGAVVSRNVLPFTLVLGNPARAVGKVNEGGTRLTQD